MVYALYGLCVGFGFYCLYEAFKGKSLKQSGDLLSVMAGTFAITVAVYGFFIMK